MSAGGRLRSRNGNGVVERRPVRRGHDAADSDDPGSEAFDRAAIARNQVHVLLAGPAGAGQDQLWWIAYPAYAIQLI